MLWIPSTKKLMSSSWADFGCNSLPIPAQARPVKAQALELGKLKHKDAVAEQETNINNLAHFPTPTGSDTPTSFRAAMQSTEAKQWKQAIESELNNLCRKAVGAHVTKPNMLPKATTRLRGLTTPRLLPLQPLSHPYSHFHIYACITYGHSLTQLAGVQF
jgi:hypothetical protein